MFGKKPSDTTDATLKQPAMVVGAVSQSMVSAPLPEGEIARYRDGNLETQDYREAKRRVIADLLDQLDFAAMEMLPAAVKRRRVEESTDIVLPKITVPLTQAQMALIKIQVLEEILGFGPLEPLLNDPNVNDIMVNTARRVFIERAGKLYLTDIQFTDEAHLIGVVQRIVSRVGRRIDEANPMVDARMPDGSRFNAIIPPLALDGCLVSIRKFKKNKLPLSSYIQYESMNEAMAKFLAIAAAIRLNIIISGGTGSGKTTLLNALSGHIDAGERIVTIEDAAELKLDQPHVLRLETRPSSTEGKGEVTQRALVRNALRMRPDRIILGEMRGEEVMDVLTAMNTGHDGSMATIHANNPRDCLSRIENLVAMSSVQVQAVSLRQQIANAVQLIVQIQRMRDGKRRITHIEAITGFADGQIQTQTLFAFKIHPHVDTQNILSGDFVAYAPPEDMRMRAQYFNQEQALLACFAPNH
jgi:pilus assembly protein CpaF